MWFLAIGLGVLGYAGYELFWPKGEKKVEPSGAGAFTAPGTVQVGDVVTVALISVEPVESETSLSGTSALSNSLVPTAQDEAMMASLMATAASGATAKFQVTATGLKGEGSGGPVNTSIGVLLSSPALSFRLPAAFATASVRQIERGGKIVSTGT